MKVKVRKIENLIEREIKIPPSKSLAHRALICASLAEGESIIHNIDYNDDILATLQGLEKLGVSFEKGERSVKVFGKRLTTSKDKKVIDCNESGSTLRFLIPIFAQTTGLTLFTGKGRLLERPLAIYQNLFQAQGKQFDIYKDRIDVMGPLEAQEFIIPGDVSSQFISGLFFILPLLKKDSIVKVKSPFESQSYVKLTLDMLEQFGVLIEKKEEGIYFIQGNQQYKPQEIEIEGDFSQFAFFAALGCFKGPIQCKGLSHHSSQGDRSIVDHLKAMGAKVEEIESGYEIHPSSLSGATFNLQECPDLGPILSVCGSLAKGKTELTGISRLRLKESDRVQAIETELKKLGVQIESSEQKQWIYSTQKWVYNEPLSGHRDHRIVMALVIGAICSNQEIEISTAEAIHKSYPSFFDELRRLGIQITEEGEL